MDLNAIQVAVEKACIEFQNPATHAQAEQVLLHFRQQHRPAVPACRHILQHSNSAEARFQAALALKEALVKEWAPLSQQDKDGLQAWLLHEIVQLANQTAAAAAAVGSSSAAGVDRSAQVVQSSLVSTLAVAVKRGWMDKPPEARPALLQEVAGLVTSCGAGGGGVAAASAGLSVFEALITEFNLVTASPLGLPWDYHSRCARDMEDNHLQNIFSCAVALARQAALSGAVLRGEDGGVTAAALSLMSTCLTWEFKRAGMPGQASLHVPHAKQRSTVEGLNPITPGQSWSNLLMSPDTSQWLMTLLQQLRATYGPITSSSTRVTRANSPGAAALAALTAPQRSAVVNTALKGRSLLLALCSLSGDVFPSDDTSGMMRLQFLCVLLQGVLPLAWPIGTALATAAASGYESSELLDACRCILALAPIHRARLLQAAGNQVLWAATPGAPGLEGPIESRPAPAIPGATAGGFLGVLEQVTLALIQVGGVNSNGLSSTDDGDDRYWQQECSDMLLEAWCALMVPDHMWVQGRPDGSLLPPGTTEAAAAVFKGLVDAALHDAARGAADELNDAYEAVAQSSQEEWMARAASLARGSPVTAFAHLAHALTASQQALAATASSGQDPSVPLEQLSWLIRMSAHCLADSGAGETPLLPLPLSQALELGIPGAGEVMLQLCSTLLSLPAMVLSPQARPVMSPRLMESCLWALARWIDTYLFPDENLPEPLRSSYALRSPQAGNGALLDGASGKAADAGPGMAVLDMAVQVANTCLTAYPGEAELHKQVVCVLLPVLVRRKSLCEKLVTLSSWQALADAFAGRAAVLQQGLGQKLHRGLSQYVCMAASGFPRTSAASQYVTHLLGATVNEVVALAGRADLSSIASRADVVVGMCCLLETVRGSQRAVLARTQAAFWAAASTLLQPLLSLQSAFKAHGQAVALILKLAAEMVEAHVSYLKPAEVEMLLRWVLALLQQYAAHNTWTARLAAPGSQQEAAHVEAARDLRALLRLLSHVTQRDLVADGGSGGSGLAATTAANAHHDSGGLDTAQVVLAGLHVLLPLISPELLKFPKLPRLYFNLLAYMMESYADQVCSLTGEQFSTLLTTLDYGYSEAITDNVVLQSALEGLAGLARYQQHCMAAGSPGLNRHSTAGGQSVTSHLLELLLKRLLLGDWGQDIVELAADALQPLMAVESQTYTALAQQLIQAQVHDAAASQRMSTALGSLLQPENGAAGSAAPGRHHKRVFRQALCQVVTDVRSLLYMR